MKKFKIILPITIVALVLTSCGKDTCTCTEGGAYARNAARDAGYEIEPNVYDFTVGEKAWDTEKHEMIEYTQEYIDAHVKDLESQGYTCEWE
jgi:hypothetical protein